MPMPAYLALACPLILGSTILPAMPSGRGQGQPIRQSAPEQPKRLVGFGACIDLDRAVLASGPSDEAIHLVLVEVPRLSGQAGPQGLVDHCTPVVFTNLKGRKLILETPEDDPEAAGSTYIDCGRAFGAFQRPAGAGYLCTIRPKDTIRIATDTLLPERKYRLRAQDGSEQWTVLLRFRQEEPPAPGRP